MLTWSNTIRHFDCGVCGNETAEHDFVEGICKDCHETRQRELDLHNAGFDRWEKMTPVQRESEIKWAMNHG